MALSQVTAPVEEPVKLNEAKRQVRRTDLDDDDPYLQDTLIPAVRERGQQATRRQFVTATWDLTIDESFPCAIVLPLPPLQAVEYIHYVDIDGVTQTLATDQYLVDAPGVVTVDATPRYRVLGDRPARGRIVPAYGVTWPSTRCQINAVTVRFLCGYGDTAAEMPARLKMALLLDLGTLFENREDQVVGQGYSITPFTTGSDAVYRAFKSY